jgi:hypothetical protein
MARHRNLIVRTLGLIVMLVGLHKAVWVMFNLFIAPQPAFIESSATSAGMSMVIGVLLIMLGGLMFAWRKPAPSSIEAEGLTPGVEETLRALVGAGKTAEAIEAYRAATGADRKTAVEAVSRMSPAA